jgi:TolB-like protein
MSFTPTQIIDQVNKISQSSVLRNSPVLRQFLHFVVDETLEGRGEKIKEYTIGTQVLGRRTDFDPQLDAIVRIHAGRLRRALNEFYAGTGKNDPLKISIPKGGYAPNFSSNSTSPRNFEILPSTREKDSKPVLAVMPFRNVSPDLSHDFFCLELGEFVSTELARFQELSLISYSSCASAAKKTGDISEISALLSAGYVLTGSIFIDQENLRILTQLSKGDTGRQLWSHTFTRKAPSTELFQIQEQIVNMIAASLGGYYGVIYRDVADGWSAMDHDKYDTLYLYDKWIKSFDQNVFDQSCEILEQIIRKDPSNVLALAVLCEMYGAGAVMRFNRIEKQIDVAIQYAKKAVSIDPLSQHAFQALAVGKLMGRNKAETIAAAEKCIALNPRASNYTAAMGSVLIFAGEFERGAKVLRDSLSLNPFFPWMHALAFSVYYYNKNEFELAKVWAEKMEMPNIPWSPILKVASYAQLGQTEAAAIAVDDLIALVPEVCILGRPFLGSFILDDNLVDKIAAGLEKTGLRIEQTANAQEINR